VELQRHGCLKYSGTGMLMSNEWSVAQVEGFLRECLPAVFRYIDTLRDADPAASPFWYLLGKSARSLFVAVQGDLATGEDLVRFRSRDGLASQWIIYIGVFFQISKSCHFLLIIFFKALRNPVSPADISGVAHSISLGGNPGNDTDDRAEEDLGWIKKEEMGDEDLDWESKLHNCRILDANYR
jgi:hypothetical protein